RRTDVNLHIVEVMHRVLQRYTLERAPWREFQRAGLMWTPLRKSHENVADPHWEKRRTFAEVEHPELGRSFTYPIAKWVTRWPEGVDWRRGPRAPRGGEHSSAGFRGIGQGGAGGGSTARRPAHAQPPQKRPGRTA